MNHYPRPSVLVELHDAAGLICMFCLSRVPSVGERINIRYIVTAVDHEPQTDDPKRPDARIYVKRDDGAP